MYNIMSQIGGNFYLGNKARGGGGGNARPRSMDINTISTHSTLNNTYVYGSGVGASNVFTRRANLRAMSSYRLCKLCYNTL